MFGYENLKLTKKFAVVPPKDVIISLCSLQQKTKIELMVALNILGLAYKKSADKKKNKEFATEVREVTTPYMGISSYRSVGSRNLLITCKSNIHIFNFIQKEIIQEVYSQANKITPQICIPDASTILYRYTDDCGYLEYGKQVTTFSHTMNLKVKEFSLHKKETQRTKGNTIDLNSSDTKKDTQINADEELDHIDNNGYAIFDTYDYTKSNAYINGCKNALETFKEKNVRKTDLFTHTTDSVTLDYISSFRSKVDGKWYEGLAEYKPVIKQESNWKKQILDQAEVPFVKHEIRKSGFISKSPDYFAYSFMHINKYYQLSQKLMYHYKALHTKNNLTNSSNTLASETRKQEDKIVDGNIVSNQFVKVVLCRISDCSDQYDSKCNKSFALRKFKGVIGTSKLGCTDTFMHHSHIHTLKQITEICKLITCEKIYENYTVDIIENVANSRCVDLHSSSAYPLCIDRYYIFNSCNIPLIEMYPLNGEDVSILFQRDVDRQLMDENAKSYSSAFECCNNMYDEPSLKEKQQAFMFESMSEAKNIPTLLLRRMIRVDQKNNNKDILHAFTQATINEETINFNNLLKTNSIQTWSEDIDTSLLRLEITLCPFIQTLAFFFPIFPDISQEDMHKHQVSKFQIMIDEELITGAPMCNKRLRDVYIDAQKNELYQTHVILFKMFCFSWNVIINKYSLVAPKKSSPFYQALEIGDYDLIKRDYQISFCMLYRICMSHRLYNSISMCKLVKGVGGKEWEKVPFMSTEYVIQNEPELQTTNKDLYSHYQECEYRCQLYIDTHVSAFCYVKWDNEKWSWKDIGWYGYKQKTCTETRLEKDDPNPSKNKKVIHTLGNHSPIILYYPHVLNLLPCEDELPNNDDCINHGNIFSDTNSKPNNPNIKQAHMHLVACKTKTQKCQVRNLPNIFCKYTIGALSPRQKTEFKGFPTIHLFLVQVVLCGMLGNLVNATVRLKFYKRVQIYAPFISKPNGSAIPIFGPNFESDFWDTDFEEQRAHGHYYKHLLHPKTANIKLEDDPSNNSTLHKKRHKKEEKHAVGSRARDVSSKRHGNASQSLLKQAVMSSIKKITGRTVSNFSLVSNSEDEEPVLKRIAAQNIIYKKYGMPPTKRVFTLSGVNMYNVNRWNNPSKDWFITWASNHPSLFLFFLKEYDQVGFKYNQVIDFCLRDFDQWFMSKAKLHLVMDKVRNFINNECGIQPGYFERFGKDSYNQWQDNTIMDKLSEHVVWINKDKKEAVADKNHQKNVLQFLEQICLQFHEETKKCFVKLKKGAFVDITIKSMKRVLSLLLQSVVTTFKNYGNLTDKKTTKNRNSNTKSKGSDDTNSQDSVNTIQQPKNLNDLMLFVGSVMQEKITSVESKSSKKTNSNDTETRGDDDMEDLDTEKECISELDSYKQDDALEVLKTHQKTSSKNPDETSGIEIPMVKTVGNHIAPANTAHKNSRGRASSSIRQDPPIPITSVTTSDDILKQRGRGRGSGRGRARSNISSFYLANPSKGKISSMHNYKVSRGRGRGRGKGTKQGKKTNCIFINYNSHYPHELCTVNKDNLSDVKHAKTLYGRDNYSDIHDQTEKDKSSSPKKGPAKKAISQTNDISQATPSSSSSSTTTNTTTVEDLADNTGDKLSDQGIIYTNFVSELNEDIKMAAEIDDDLVQQQQDDYAQENQKTNKGDIKVNKDTFKKKTTKDGIFSDNVSNPSNPSSVNNEKKGDFDKIEKPEDFRSGGSIGRAIRLLATRLPYVDSTLMDIVVRNLTIKTKSTKRIYLSALSYFGIDAFNMAFLTSMVVDYEEYDIADFAMLKRFTNILLHSLSDFHTTRLFIYFYIYRSIHSYLLLPEEMRNKQIWALRRKFRVNPSCEMPQILGSVHYSPATKTIASNLHTLTKPYADCNIDVIRRLKFNNVGDTLFHSTSMYKQPPIPNCETTTRENADLENSSARNSLSQEIHTESGHRDQALNAAHTLHSIGLSCDLQREYLQSKWKKTGDADGIDTDYADYLAQDTKMDFGNDKDDIMNINMMMQYINEESHLGLDNRRSELLQDIQQKRNEHNNTSTENTSKSSGDRDLDEHDSVSEKIITCIEHDTFNIFEKFLIYMIVHGNQKITSKFSKFLIDRLTLHVFYNTTIDISQKQIVIETIKWLIKSDKIIHIIYRPQQISKMIEAFNEPSTLDIIYENDDIVIFIIPKTKRQYSFLKNRSRNIVEQNNEIFKLHSFKKTYDDAFYAIDLVGIVKKLGSKSYALCCKCGNVTTLNIGHTIKGTGDIHCGVHKTNTKSISSIKNINVQPDKNNFYDWSEIMTNFLM